MIAHSIRWRLQLWLAFLLASVLTGFVVAVHELQRVNQFNQVDEELERRVAALSAALRGRPPFDFGSNRRHFDSRNGKPGTNQFPDRPPPGGPPPPGDGPGGPPRRPEFRVSPELASQFDATRSNGFYFVVWFRDKCVLSCSTNAPEETPPPPRRDESRTYTQTRGHFREAYHYTEQGDCVLAGRPVIAEITAARKFTFWLIAAGATVLGLGLSVGWWLTTRALRPIEDISAAASRISAGNLSERIAETGADDELGRLAGVLNSTFARLEAAFARQRQFTADASHELRTPLAVIISEAQTVLAREREALEYRETLKGCLETAQQMRRLTESLLQLARLDAGQELAERKPLDLAGETQACLKRIEPLAASRGIQIHSQLVPANCVGDVQRLGQVITNLLTNAIQHNRPGGEVRVATGMEGNDATITVADNGPGIAAEDLPHIFERFYRADKSRSHADAHSGLGLAISKAIVDAEGGRIEVASQIGVGATFTVRLPRERDEYGSRVGK